MPPEPKVLCTKESLFRLMTEQGLETWTVAEPHFRMAVTGDLLMSKRKTAVLLGAFLLATSLSILWRILQSKQEDQKDRA